MNTTAKKLLPAGEPHERRHPLEEGGVRITTFVPLQFRKRGIKKVVVAPVGIEDPAKGAQLVPELHLLVVLVDLAHRREARGGREDLGLLHVAAGEALHLQ